MPFDDVANSGGGNVQQRGKNRAGECRWKSGALDTSSLDQIIKQSIDGAKQAWNLPLVARLQPPTEYLPRRQRYFHIVVQSAEHDPSAATPIDS